MADRHNSFALLLTAPWANAKQFQRMCHLAVSHPFCQLLQCRRRAQIKRFHLGADAADDVMMMILCIQLVSIRSIAEITSPHKLELFEDSEIAIHRHEIA